MSQLLRPIAWNHDIPRRPAEVAWLWSGLLARGNLTLLTGGWKCGKTTLVALLLDRRREGGLLLNRVVEPGGAVIVSEEDPTLWQRRQERLDFGPNVGFWCRPFAGRPTAERWGALLDELLELRQSRNIDLVVIDPLAMFVPASENHPSSLLAALNDLQRLTHAGLAVLLLHHPAKGAPRPGQAARGTGALPACADILLELRIPERHDAATRRRRLLGFSRYEDTPRRLSIELTADAADYAVCSDSEDDPSFGAALQVLRLILHQATEPLTRQQILAAWPAPLPRPEHTTLWRWLARATTLGIFTHSGLGTKTDAFRYSAAQSNHAP